MDKEGFSSGSLELLKTDILFLRFRSLDSEDLMLEVSIHLKLEKIVKPMMERLIHEHVTMERDLFANPEFQYLETSTLVIQFHKIRTMDGSIFWMRTSLLPTGISRFLLSKTLNMHELKMICRSIHLSRFLFRPIFHRICGIKSLEECSLAIPIVYKVALILDDFISNKLDR